MVCDRRSFEWCKSSDFQKNKKEQEFDEQILEFLEL